MKSLYLSALLFGAHLGLSAQTITDANIPQLGDSIGIDIMSVMVAPGASGSGQTWDFSTAVGTQTGFFKFVDPATTIFSYRFPNSNICGVSWEGSYAYYDFQPGVLNTDGYGLLVSPGDSVISVYNDQETVVQLPFQHMDMFSDNFSGDDIALGFTFPFSGNVSVTADGSGTLITPTGTFNNVVRYHLTSTKTNPTVTIVKDQYVWMSSDHRYWLMLTETTTTNGSAAELTWWSTNPINVSVGVDNEATLGSYGLLNTLVENDILSIIGESVSPVELTIYDLTGQMVEQLSNVYLNGKFDIGIEGYTKGVYLIQFREDGLIRSERFVVK